MTAAHFADLTPVDEPDLKIDVPLLRKALEYITAHPDEWNQGSWGRKTACGTSACLAGWTLMLTGSFVWEDARCDCEYCPPHTRNEEVWELEGARANGDTRACQCGGAGAAWPADVAGRPPLLGRSLALGTVERGEHLHRRRDRGAGRVRRESAADEYRRRLMQQWVAEEDGALAQNRLPDVRAGHRDDGVPRYRLLLSRLQKMGRARRMS